MYTSESRSCIWKKACCERSKHSDAQVKVSEDQTEAAEKQVMTQMLPVFKLETTSYEEAYDLASVTAERSAHVLSRSDL